MSDENLLVTTRAFWDANPCGVHAEYEQQKIQRYAMEPWIPTSLVRIGSRHASILEVGCGQGIDSTLLCAAIRSGGRYVGVDYSAHSVDVARHNAVSLAARLSVPPEYRVGNAEALEFPDRSFEAVYSLGVIHHTANESAAIHEVYRVLEPGGTAYIFLYRKFSPKVAVAKLLRLFQSALDTVFGTERCIYQLLKHRGSHTKRFGTMFHECFGVPYMKWYSRNEIRNLFSEFKNLKLTCVGANLGRVSWGGTQETRLGYFWSIQATK